jgi:hypothetical protein
VVVLALAVGLFGLFAPVVYDRPSHGLGYMPMSGAGPVCPHLYQSLALEYLQYGGVRLATSQYCIAQVIHDAHETQFDRVMGGRAVAREWAVLPNGSALQCIALDKGHE